MYLDDWCAYKIVAKYKLKKFSTLHLGIRLKGQCVAKPEQVYSAVVRENEHYLTSV